MEMYHWGTIRQANAEPSDWFLHRLVFPNPQPAFAPIQPHGLTRLAIQDRVLGIILLVTALAGEHQE
jgi:hypothetical protein